jgi:hypothetical protein
VQLAELKTTELYNTVYSSLLKTKHELVILIRRVVFNSASCTHAQIFLFRRACRLLAAHLIFGLHVTNDENAVNVARTRGNVVNPTCHE